MKFLFCSLDSPGFLFPAIGSALELRAKQHEVAFVTNIDCEKWLAPCGLIRMKRGDQDGNSFQSSVWGQPWAVAIQVKHIEYAIKQFQPDVLVGQQLTFGVLIAAERLNIPVALLGFCTYLWPVLQEQADDEAAGRKWQRFKEMRERYDTTRSMFRLPASNPDFAETGLLGDLFMLRTIPELEQDYQALPERVHLVGPCMWEPPGDDPELENWMTDVESVQQPIIYVQQGRFFDRPHFWPKVREALASQPVRIVSSTGAMDCELGEVATNFFARPHVPQGQVFRRAKALIAGGNTTAVLGALVAGVPSVLIPAGGEQPDVAERCRQAGVARVLAPDDASPEGLVVALNLILRDLEMANRAERLGRSFRAANDFQLGCGLLENLAATRAPVSRLQHCTAGV